MTETNYDALLVETRGAVGLITLNRPKALNALNARVIEELALAFEAFEADDAVGAVVVTGSERAFAAGADIKEMADKTYAEAFLEDFTPTWRRLLACRKPSIAAVAGYALGGGCELAMMCDMIFAADTAKFGQPEITLGIVPGFGGTQRLARAVGKAKAMDLILTGRMMDAAEAERSGLVARVLPPERLLDEALEAAEKIAGFSRLAALSAKEAVDVAFEGSLSEGVRLERRLFQALFATEDQKEGMAAFVDKRKPAFRNR
ncbi:enoyl-CoA hydratase [Methylopila musalis]|uniref:Enoyl-CoA hydratase n=1 Tax=Methylopila musalis TaxID=1134781 RepID=A0ABW3Z8X9_9HYPH